MMVNFDPAAHGVSLEILACGAACKTSENVSRYIRHTNAKFE